MIRFISIFLSVSLIVFLAVPIFASDIDGGYFFIADCSIGDGVKFYVPSSFIGDLTTDSSGDVFNLSNSTIYLFCPDYPDYSIRASRFSNFVFSYGSGYNPTTYDLNVSNIVDSNFSFLHDTAFHLDIQPILISIFSVIFLFGFIGFFLFRRS